MGGGRRWNRAPGGAARSWGGGTARRCGLGGAYVIGRAVKKATEEALALERTMITVQKATNASGADLKGYERAILDMARATGKSKEELGGILAAAGFAGRPIRDLTRFTEYAAMATGAWQTNAQETGQALAEIGNIFRAPQARIEEIGDAINHIADNAAASEADLMEFLRRAGAVGGQAGLSAEQVLAFGAAFKEIGTRTDVAATGFQALMGSLTLGAEFTKHAKDGFKSLGINIEKFQRSFVAKPLETTVELLERIAAVKDPLKRASILNDVYGKEYGDDIARLTGNMEGLRRILGLVASSSSYLGSVKKNFDVAIDTDVGRIERATQALDILWTRAGSYSKSVAGGIAEEVNKLVNAVENGESLFQRIMRRVEAYNTEKNGPGVKPPLDGAAEWVRDNAISYIPAVAGYNALSKWAGGTAAEATVRGREAAIAERIAQEERVFERIEDLRNRKAKMDLPGARVPIDVKDSIARELDAAERQGREIQSRRFLGLRINNPGAADGLTRPAGLSAFGFDLPAAAWSADGIPLPPPRPGSGPVDTTSLDAAKDKAVDAGEAIQALGVAVAPHVDLSSIRAARSEAERLLATLNQIGSAMQTASATHSPSYGSIRDGMFDLGYTAERCCSDRATRLPPARKHRRRGFGLRCKSGQGGADGRNNCGARRRAGPSRDPGAGRSGGREGWTSDGARAHSGQSEYESDRLQGKSAGHPDGASTPPEGSNLARSIAALAADGWSAAEIATALRIPRARVHRIARRAGLALARGGGGRRRLVLSIPAKHMAVIAALAAGARVSRGVMLTRLAAVTRGGRKRRPKAARAMGSAEEGVSAPETGRRNYAPLKIKGLLRDPSLSSDGLRQRRCP